MSPLLSLIIINSITIMIIVTVLYIRQMFKLLFLVPVPGLLPSPCILLCYLSSGLLPGGQGSAIMAAGDGGEIEGSGVGGCTSSSDSATSIKKFASIFESNCDNYMKESLETTQKHSFFIPPLHSVHFRM